MSKCPSPERTLLSYKLPAMLADRVAALPGHLQAPVIQIVQDHGIEGLDQILAALAPGGRPSDYAERLPLLRQMAGEMMATDPHLGRNGRKCRQKDVNAAAAKVANSPAGRALGHSLEATRKWLIRAWAKNGLLLLDEHIAAEAVRNNEKMARLMEQFRMMADIPFVQRLEDLDRRLRSGTWGLPFRTSFVHPARPAML